MFLALHPVLHQSHRRCVVAGPEGQNLPDEVAPDRAPDPGIPSAMRVIVREIAVPQHVARMRTGHLSKLRIKLEWHEVVGCSVVVEKRDDLRLLRPHASLGRSLRRLDRRVRRAGAAPASAGDGALGSPSLRSCVLCCHSYTIGT
jgi:hypothetical protein